jgi:hypothetical protein
MARAASLTETARLEALHDQPLTALGVTDDPERVREQLVLVTGTPQEEVAALQPLERDGARHDGVDRRMGGLRGPRADHIFEKNTDKLPASDRDLAVKRFGDFKARMDAEPRRRQRAAGHDVGWRSS